jgi:hypothetical protein
VEKSLYGWFWECPNGEKCIYKHALPPGYVLKKDKKKMEAQKETISLVDLIERERAALGSNQTRITLETFLAWKKRKIQEKKDREKKEEDKKRKDFKEGRSLGLSGREMFSFNPEMAETGLDEGEAAIESYGREEEDGENAIEYKELDLNMLSLNIKDVDNTGTVADDDRWQKMKDNAEPSTSATVEVDAAPINENLFLDQDLEGLDEELSDDDEEEEEETGEA